MRSLATLDDSRSSFTRMEMMDLKRRRSSGRRGSFQLHIGLRSDQLDAVTEIIRMANSSLGLQCRDEIRFCRSVKHPDWSNVLSILSDFVNSPGLQPQAVFQVHSLMGSLHYDTKSYRMAVQSFTKALWLASSSAEIDPVHLGLTLHHLGLIHGALSNHEEAMNLLKKALTVYQTSKLPPSNPVHADASSQYSSYCEKLKFSEQAWCSLPQFRLESVEEHEYSLHGGDCRVERRPSM